MEVELERGDRGLRLEVRDDGKGIASDAVSSPSSLSLLGIRERARTFGGAVRVSGAAGKGTRVVVEIPIESCGGEA